MTLAPVAPALSRWTLDLPRGRTLELVAGRPLLMGVLNLTPDSFSDGGDLGTPAAALERALTLAAGGADLLDLGAESTRPGGGVYGEGAAEVSVDEELRRLLPALERIRRATALPISVDTRKAAVAEAALAAGADLVNDVSALGDPGMAPLLAPRHEVPLVLMHSRGELRRMQRGIAFGDLLAEVRGELGAAISRARQAGIAASRLILDPGLGFGKTAEQSRRLVVQLSAFAPLERPLLIGASRKSFLTSRDGEAPRERLAASLAAAAWAVRGGAAILRVHDVAATRRFLEQWQALAAAAEPA